MTTMNGHGSTNNSSKEYDRDLIQQIGTGDPKVLSILYDRYKTLVFSLAIKITGSHETAEDITLDVFTQIWKNADARYRSIDTLRRRKVRSDINRPQWSDVQLETLPSNDNPGEALELEETRHKVSGAIAKLPEDQQKVLAMAYFKGYSHRQISAALDEPLGTIKTRIRLGLQKLRRIFKDENILD